MSIEAAFSELYDPRPQARSAVRIELARGRAEPELPMWVANSSFAT
ncbi:hypothetical protein [Burkholderia territorii]|nr:hypothetical protein [Burkholderia territorii]